MVSFFTLLIRVSNSSGIINLSVGNFTGSTFGDLILSVAPIKELPNLPSGVSAELSKSANLIVNLSTSGEALLTNLPLERKFEFLNGNTFDFLLDLNISFTCPTTAAPPP